MRRPATHLLVALLALAHVAVLVAPALVLAGAARKGGVAGLHGYDLLVASALLGSVHGAVVWRRLRRAQGQAGLTNAVLAGVDGLLVVAVTATSLLFVLLGAQGPWGAVLVNEGVPVLLLWVAMQLAAVLLGENTTRIVARWLARDPDAPPGDEDPPPTGTGSATRRRTAG